MRKNLRLTVTLSQWCAGAALVFLNSCTGDPAATKTDSVAKDTSAATVDPSAPKSMTVTAPVSPVPKQTADSIWNGDFVEKYPNGLVKKRGYIAGGLATGEWLTFYEDGKPWSKGYYEKGERTGYGVAWHHDGQKSQEGYYNHGKPVGVWSYWSESTHQLTVKDWGGEMPDTTGQKR